MGKREIEGLLFDLDDTLYDRRVAGRRRDERFVDTHLGLTDAMERQEALDLLAVLDNGGYGSKPVLCETVRRQYPAITQDAETLEEIFSEHLFQVLTLPDETRGVIEALAQREMPFGVITNGKARIQGRKLEILGISQSARCAFISEAFGCSKPDARIFAAAAAALGLAPEAILFVGDHPILDIAGAAGAGMQTAWLTQGRAWPADLSVVPDACLGALLDVLPLLDRTAGTQRL